MFEAAALAMGVGAVNAAEAADGLTARLHWAGGVISAMADRCRTMGGYCG
jgi:hypothetical protein